MSKNPYEQGKNDALAGHDSKNPHREFTDKWALYNSGFNLHHPLSGPYFREQQRLVKQGK